MTEGFAVLIGYLLGSLLPCYLIGRARGIDLRTLGDGNLGTTNASKYLGKPIGVVEAIWDLSKGLVAMLIAARVLHVPEPWVFLSGLMAIVGHRYPFYVRFRGGRGYATATGLLFASVGITLSRGWLSASEVIILALAYGGLAFIYHGRTVPNVFLLPVYLAALVWRSRSAPDVWFDLFVLAIIAFVWVNAVRTMRREHILGLHEETRSRLKEIRVLLRPLALAFPVLYLFVDKGTMLILVGSVAAVFVLIDVLRLLSRRVNVAVLRKASFFYRPNEEHTFSSATLFLVGSFITLFLFTKPVASTALVYVIVGDLLAKYAGLEHGRTAVFASRTLEGSLMYFIACAVAGFIWAHFVVIGQLAYLVGALAAAVTEMLPWEINDNFAVPIISGAVMTGVVAIS